MLVTKSLRIGDKQFKFLLYILKIRGLTARYLTFLHRPEFDFFTDYGYKYLDEPKDFLN